MADGKLEIFDSRTGELVETRIFESLLDAEIPLAEIPNIAVAIGESYEIPTDMVAFFFTSLY